jgi:YjbE family integral membrane protein
MPGGFAETMEQWTALLVSNLGDYGPLSLQILKIIWINILLSGDNAVVIALACRALPPRQRFWGIILGAGAAVILRVIFTVGLQYLLGLPWLRLIGGVLLLWIAVKLLIQEEADETSVASSESLWGAVRTVAIADIVMSLDNVLAIAAAARGDTMLIVFGLAISIPLIVAGATLIMALLTRFPILVWAGAGLLGWIAGELLMEDPVSRPYLDAIGADYGLTHKAAEYVMQVVCTAFVLVCGWLLMKWRSRGAVGVPGHKGGPAE